MPYEFEYRLDTLLCWLYFCSSTEELWSKDTARADLYPRYFLSFCRNTYVLVFLARFGKLFIYADQNAVCVSLCVWLLTRLAQIVTAADRDLQSSIHIPTNEP